MQRLLLLLVVVVLSLDGLVDAKPAMRRLLERDGRPAVQDPRHHDPNSHSNPYYDNRKRRQSLTKGMTVTEAKQQ